MKHPRLFAAGGVAALALGGGIAAASASGSTAQVAATAVATSVTVAHRAPATIHAASVRVGGRSVRILETSKGLPLYIYGHDTTTTSQVTGQLARFWPPLLSAHPTESGVTGKLTVVKDPGRSQVRYNDHFLYTFVEDTPGHPTGQGVEDFFLATPTGEDTTVPSPPAPTASTPPTTPATTPATSPSTSGPTGSLPPTTSGTTGSASTTTPTVTSPTTPPPPPTTPTTYPYTY